jgi:hypothetical protein
MAMFEADFFTCCRTRQAGYDWVLDAHFPRIVIPAQAGIQVVLSMDLRLAIFSVKLRTPESATTYWLSLIEVYGMKNLTAQLRNLGASEDWLAAWEKTENSPVAACPDFLHSGYIDEACSYLCMAAENTVALREAVAEIKTDPDLSRLLVFCRNSLLSENLSPKNTEWPRLHELPCLLSGLLGLLTVLACLPEIRKNYGTAGIPEKVVRDTLGDFEVKLNAFRKSSGKPGYVISRWIGNFIRAEIFWLGRLQFALAAHNQQFMMLRRKADGIKLVLAEEGLPFRADGFWFHPDDPSPDSWTSRFEETDRYFRGNPVSAHGRAQRQDLTLSKTEWECVLKREDPILGVHIPAQGKMDHALCGESFSQALDFFPKYLPEYRFKAFTCNSWLLDPQFDGFLPEDANIVRFLKEWYIYPIAGRQSGILNAVFGKPDVDVKTVTLDNSLKKAVAEHILSGGLWQGGGGGIITPEDLNWGKQVYWQQKIASL